MSRMLAQENVRADVGQRGGADETDQEAAKASGEGPERSDHWNLCSEEVHISSGGGNSQFYCWGPIDFDLIVKLFLVSKKARKRSACPAKRRLWPAPWKLPKHVGRSGAKLISTHWNWTAITRKEPIFSDKFLPHSQISGFMRFFAPPSPVDFSLIPPPHRTVHPW